ncbi:hypothetical protein RvY_04071 [Ramazzottius varieornatus]|uniref:Uncharacterized protein n=1 Tax=Ramazzottius varieornatus TaxID=947166 RepID=A0A1D1UZK9_RAMVA|nr:hypothetical protein RvY_04071 [Ramazzottius varieornatus]
MNVRSLRTPRQLTHIFQSSSQNVPSAYWNIGPTGTPSVLGEEVSSSQFHNTASRLAPSPEDRRFNSSRPFNVSWTYFRDSLSFFAGWTVIALGFALSIHASRSMMHDHAMSVVERDNLPVPPDQLLDEA